MVPKKIRPSLYMFDDLPGAWVHLPELATTQDLPIAHLWETCFKVRGREIVEVFVEDVGVQRFFSSYYLGGGPLEEGVRASGSVTLGELEKIYIPLWMSALTFNHVPEITRKSTSKGLIYRLFSLGSFPLRSASYRESQVPEIHHDDLIAFEAGIRPDRTTEETLDLKF